MNESYTTGNWQVSAEASWISKRQQRYMPKKVESLRQKLYEKAKQEPKFRFYALYDRIYRADVLEAAWDQVRINKGSAGVDGVSIETITSTAGMKEKLLEELHEELRLKQYRPQPIMRVYIPKSDGTQRPLGIPTLRDRVVQAAVLLVLEPIFEADFKDVSYGFRPARGCHDALKAIYGHLKSGYTEIYDADLQGYFDSIPHDKLMACVEMRVSDRSVLKVIRMFLTSTVVEKGKPPQGRPKQGVPQGGVISPLLANVFLHWFDVVFHREGGPGHGAQAKLVRYADDFVVMVRRMDAEIPRWIEDKLENWMGLTINKKKTDLVKLKEPRKVLNFLGYQFSYVRSSYRRGGRYLKLEPAKASLLRERSAIRGMTNRSKNFVPIKDLIDRINLHRSSWANYFSLGSTSHAYRQLNTFTRDRLYIHLRKRSQRPYKLPARMSWYRHCKELGYKELGCKRC